MDADPERNPPCEPPGAQKRSLRVAVDGSPARPEPKSVRGYEDECVYGPPETCEDSQATNAVFTRYRAHPIFSLYRDFFLRITTE